MRKPGPGCRQEQDETGAGWSGVVQRVESKTEGKQQAGDQEETEKRNDFPLSRVWRVSSDCVKKKKKTSAVRECVYDSSSSSSSSGLEVKCSDSVRLVSGPSLCSGSVQILDQSWTWVCEGALDQQGAEVLCRELGCGAPSLLQGALSPLKQKFQCEGHESALMDCPRSGSETCSSGAAVNLTCSGPPSSPSVWMLWLVRPLLVSSPYAVCTVLLVLIYREQRRTGSAHVVSMETGQQEEEYDDIGAEVTTEHSF
ncbi:deleted in malignant brain tumors 1 protein-like [Periophthalmus magnuspinnatus]|uniref:deleted in malignant brain tumors 1 protein-like n=1 Tax=Periophthalmus magnuspinnatus TaxID=409849 RepID=UPI0024363404|nr:deleted in malignant brain tumors 1 protein-like [Periophthalmus magnuspinnatus]